MKEEEEMRINHNVASLFSQATYTRNQDAMKSSLAKLSTGLRISRSADDAAGMSVSTGMNSQIKGMDIAKRNANDGIALVQTAEGATENMTNILQRMRELSVQSSNDTLTSVDRSYLQTEFTALKSEIDRISSATNYNGQTLVSKTASFNLQIGANSTAADSLKIDIQGLSTGSLKLTSVGISSGSTSSKAAITAIDVAIRSVNNMRSNLGAYVNRLEHTVSNLDTMSINTTDSLSRIQDVDMAKEYSEFTKHQVLSQSAQSMLSQANGLTQSILNLLR